MSAFAASSYRIRYLSLLFLTSEDALTIQRDLSTGGFIARGYVEHTMGYHCYDSSSYVLTR
ncbi:hypothetical protein HNQ35_000524 [Cerasibacillus quisquiliarum]|uniref:Uncharacterized protein n=1 Tax=Cerasibacillus quisquiliarum TaxID=227865 RepID=A0A511UT64_9BACI|nr:hypothetical protein [Cerasibacillus quisquiliarum]GEN29774.1 hypothetical protein CQU01_00120 [Cerasibacillus quisquiliarum]